MNYLIKNYILVLKWWNDVMMCDFFFVGVFGSGIGVILVVVVFYEYVEFFFKE